MEEKNKVSIWLGNFDNEDLFDDFMEEKFDEEGDVSSLFMESFEIDFIDNQFQEVLYDKNLEKEVLIPVSYSDFFLNKVDVDFSKYNCVVLLYNFRYTGGITKASSLDFIGVYDYRN